MTEELVKYRALAISLVIGLIVSVMMFTVMLRLDMQSNMKDFEFAAGADMRVIGSRLTSIAKDINYLSTIYRDPNRRLDEAADFLRRGQLRRLIKYQCFAEPRADVDIVEDSWCRERFSSDEMASWAQSGRAVSMRDSDEGRLIEIPLPASAARIFLSVAQFMEGIAANQFIAGEIATPVCLQLLHPAGERTVGCIGDGLSASSDDIRASQRAAGMTFESQFDTGPARWQMIAYPDPQSMARSLSVVPFMVLGMFLVGTGLGCYWVYSATGKNIDLRNQKHRLQRLVAEIEQKNDDLDQFATMAAHDLQAPLRFLSMHFFMLKDALDLPAGDDNAETLQTIEEQLERMRALIIDLLLFCRAGQSELADEQVDVAYVVMHIWQHLQTEYPDNDFQLAFDQLPELQRADRVLLNQVFSNLIENAIKYRDPSRPALVRIDAEPREHGGLWHFRVSDNGKGIAEEFRKRVLLPFQRLDTDTKGTGIGLAIVRRLVEAHGGDLWIESRDDGSAGTVICFTINEHMGKRLEAPA